MMPPLFDQRRKRRQSWKPTQERRAGDKMTIAAGFHFAHGILLCADTQHTVPSMMKLNASKIVRQDLTARGGGQLVFALSGTVAYAHMAIDHCTRAILEKPPRERTGGGLRVALEEAIENFYQHHMYPHPRYGYNDGPMLQLLIAARSDIDSTLALYATSETAVTEVIDYECVGAGAFLSNYLIPTLFRHSRMGLNDAGNIAIHVLRETKLYVDSCGGGSEFVVLDKDGKMSKVGHYDIAQGEALSEGFSTAVRRLLVVSADLETTTQKLREEFDMAFTIIEAFRNGEKEKRRDHDLFFGSLEDRHKGIHVDAEGEANL